MIRLIVSKGGCPHVSHPRARVNAKSQDETIYLAPLDAMAGKGHTLADELLERFHGRWDGDINRIFEEFAF